ncbi:MAG: hypothetical protein AAGF11_51255 [Myxococcota bacterium]
MNKHVWMITVAVAGVMALPSEAEARPPYLQALSDATEAAFMPPACPLPGMTCGLCHPPNEGDRLENVVVGGGDADLGTRNGPLFESLTGVGGWMPVAGGANAGANAMMLADEVVPTMVDMNVDSDGDGVGDIEELALGYNPLLAYDDADAEISQLCGDAEPFPDVGGSSSSGASDESSTGEPDPTTGGPIDPGTTSDGTTTSTTMPPPPDDDSSTSSTGGSGSSGGTGASDDGDDGGCRIGGSGRDAGVLGLLLALGLFSGRRRRIG